MATEDWALGSKFRTCSICKIPRQIEAFSFLVHTCNFCYTAYRARLRDMANAQAARNLTKALVEARNAKEVPNLPGIVASFMAETGGATSLGRMLAEDFKRVRGDHLSPEERALRPPKDSNLVRYYQMLLKLNESRDAQVAQADLASFTEEELKSVLTSVAMQLVMDDQDFRRTVMQAILQEDPQFFDRELASAAKVVNSTAKENANGPA